MKSASLNQLMNLCIVLSLSHSDENILVVITTWFMTTTICRDWSRNKSLRHNMGI